MMAIGDYHRAFIAAFNRADVKQYNLHGLRRRRGWKVGRAPAQFIQRRAGRAEFCRHQIFSYEEFKWLRNNLALDIDAYHRAFCVEFSRIDITVEHLSALRQRDDFKTSRAGQYVMKHRWLWEQLHGPLPKGVVLKCKGDPLNTDPSNWEAVPRAILPRLNGRFGRGYDDAPTELKPIIMTVAKLEHCIHQKATNPRKVFEHDA